MAQVAIEDRPAGGVGTADVAAWATGLESLHARIAPRFARAEPRRRALAYLRGLLGSVERKNGWQLAEAAGEATPDGTQRLLAQADRDADAVRDDLRAYVAEHLGDPAGVLVLDETGFVKKGTKSAGVARQYSGTAGRVENCQVGVFLAYASPRGRAFVDRELYLPREWATDEARRREAAVPGDVAFATKPQLAKAMLERARSAGVVGWVTADTVYGGDRRLRMWLEEHAWPHVVAIKCTEPLWTADDRGPAQVKAADLAAKVAAPAWRHLSAGDGAKGPRVYAWARVALRRFFAPTNAGYWLLVRRSLADAADVAYYVCFGPVTTPLRELVRVAGARWAIEECFEAAKGQVGLDHYEVRRYDAWYRHVTFALLAHAYLAVTRTAGGGEKGGS